MGLEKLQTPQEAAMRQALYGIRQAEALVFSAITELKVQAFTTEAANLQVVLTDLIAEREAIELAVAV